MMERMQMTSGGVRNAAAGLTMAGVLPFAAAALLTLLFGGSYEGWIAEEIATLYGAVILSFLGGIRWGAALDRGPSSALVFSVIPSLAGFGSLFVDARTALIILIAGFALQMIWDAVSALQLPEWFIRMRLGVTVFVTVCLLIVLYGAF
jgi:hypothetical protein